MNRVKLTTTTTGTGDITVSTTPAARCVPLSSMTVGTMVRMLIEDENGTDWEVSDCTVTGATTFARGKVWNGSAGPGNKTNFGAGVKSAAVVAILVPPVIPFNATIPLDRPEIAYMTPYTMTGPLTLTAGANPIDGAHVVATIIGDGTNDLTISGAVKHAGSLPFNKTAGAKNIAQFLRTPGVTRYSISQAAADVVATTPPAPAPTSITITGPTGGVVNTASGDFTVNTNVARTAAVVVTPTPVAGVTFNPTSVTLPIGIADGTFTATPNTTGAKTIAVTNDAGLTNPASITYTVSASATAPAQMAAPVATQTGATTASVALTAPSTGGSAITGYTVVSNPPGGVDSNAGTTALTHNITGLTTDQAYTFTATATNTVGTSPASPASNSVTPVAAPAGYVSGASVVSLAGDAFLVDSAGIKSLTGSASTDNTYHRYPGSGTNVKLPSGVNGWVGMRYQDTAQNDSTVGFCTTSSGFNTSTPTFGFTFDDTRLIPVYSGGVAYDNNGASLAGPVAGNIYALFVNGIEITIRRTADEGVTWVTLYTFAAGRTSDLYAMAGLYNQQTIPFMQATGLVA